MKGQTLKLKLMEATEMKVKETRWAKELNENVKQCELGHHSRLNHSFILHNEKETRIKKRKDGKECKVSRKVLGDSAKLVLMYMKLFIDPKTATRDRLGIANLSLIDISKELGCDRQTVKNAIDQLRSKKYIQFDDLERSTNKTEFEILKKAKTNKRGFERFTPIFLTSEAITMKQKEFLMLISPFLSKKEIDTLPLNNSEIAKNTGLTSPTIRKRIKELSELGYCWKADKGVYRIAFNELILQGQKACIDEIIKLRKEVEYLRNENENLKAQLAQKH